jgi:hypothetical protein
VIIKWSLLAAGSIQGSSAFGIGASGASGVNWETGCTLSHLETGVFAMTLDEGCQLGAPGPSGPSPGGTGVTGAAFPQATLMGSTADAAAGMSWEAAQFSADGTIWVFAFFVAGTLTDPVGSVGLAMWTIGEPGVNV